MSAGFRAVQWNRHKLVYDAVAILGIALYLGLYLMVAPMLFPAIRPVTAEILRIRALGTCAFLMLTIVLAIGPAARLDPLILPLLYNRRHLGVMTCLVALVHAWLVVDWYHSNGVVPPLVSLLGSSRHWSSFTGFPFEIPGILALLVLVVMAATSHDYWLKFLNPPVWKAVHMLVYGAFVLIILHVALGALQSDHSPLLPVLLLGAIGTLSFLHLRAASLEAARDRGAPPSEGWLDIGAAVAIPEGRARIVVPAAGERIAVYCHQGKYVAVGNVCAHQNGPIGEGRIIDGLITCPWHGFQFRPEDGCSPPPFTDRIAVYRLRREGDRVMVDPTPLPPGARAEPVEAAP